MTRRPFSALRTLAVTVGLGVVALGPVVPHADAQSKLTPEQLARFKGADKNGDGTLDREEFYQLMVETFYFRDKGTKGHLLLEDLPGVTAERFKAADTNGDGKLSLPEFVNFRFRDFEAADTNGDGVLTIEEVEVYMSRSR